MYSKAHQQKDATPLIICYSNNEKNNHLLEQIGPEIGASRIHNQVADQMSKSGSNGSMKQTQRDEICIVPLENNKQKSKSFLFCFVWDFRGRRPSHRK